MKSNCCLCLHNPNISFWSWSWSSFATDSQSASLSWCQAAIWDPRPIFLFPWKFLQTVACLLFCSALSDERTGLSFTCTVASGPCQSSHSRIKVPQNSRPYFTVSSETPPTWRAGSPYLYPPRTGGPVIPPGTRLLLSWFREIVVFISPYR
jgi:hypothetical protein